MRNDEQTEHTGVFKYVCLGGRGGKYDGRDRNVVGIIGGVLSSSEGSNSGEGSRGEDSSSEDCTVTPAKLISYDSSVNNRNDRPADLATLCRSLPLMPLSLHATRRSAATGTALLARLAYSWACSYSD